MEIQHLKYALEVERSKSISKAAEKLFVSQPFLSKAIRELEADIGIDIFNRTSRGVIPTKKGEDFLARAKEIMAMVDETENAYKSQKPETYNFEIVVPIACYISQAFVEFVKELTGTEEIQVDYHEVNTMVAIDHVLNHESNIGIIRYQTNFEDYYLRYLDSKDIVARPIWQYEYHLVVSRKSPLAEREDLTSDDLQGLIEISHGDPLVPSLSASTLLELRRRDGGKREIVVYERQSQFELLCEIPETYMWASPTPQNVFDTYPLVEKRCQTPNNSYKDILIYRKGYRLSRADRLFIQKVKEMVSSFDKL